MIPSGDIPGHFATLAARTIATMEWLPILEYREFYDLPRLILVETDDRFLLLDCPFEDGFDDYAADFFVYQLESDPRLSFGADWSGLPATGRLLGQVSVNSITFNSTRREALRSRELATLLR